MPPKTSKPSTANKSASRTSLQHKKMIIEHTWTIEDFFLLPQSRLPVNPLSSADFHLMVSPKERTGYRFEMKLHNRFQDGALILQVNADHEGPGSPTPMETALYGTLKLNEKSFGMPGQKDLIPIAFDLDIENCFTACLPLNPDMLKGLRVPEHYHLRIHCTIECWYDIETETEYLSAVEEDEEDPSTPPRRPSQNLGVPKLNREVSQTSTLGDFISHGSFDDADKWSRRGSVTTTVTWDGASMPIVGKDKVNLAHFQDSYTDIPQLMGLFNNVEKMYYERNKTGDVLLKCQGKTIMCHREVLISIESRVFSAILDMEAVVHRRLPIVFEEFDSPVVEAMVKFIYLGEIDHKAPVYDLYAIAVRCDLPELILKTLYKMYEDINTSNAVFILSKAHLHHHGLLLGRCINFIAQNFRDVSRTQSWKELGDKFPSVHKEIMRRIHSIKKEKWTYDGFL